jgi:low affinity Fe/Cu permease
MPRKPSASEPQNLFRDLARMGADKMGSAGAFLVATATVLAWAVSGPLFGFSDTWQLVINTGTTIVTFLMVFLIQNTQNRDSRAIHAKLDELLVATGGARSSLAAAEELSDEELVDLKEEFEDIAHAAKDSRAALPAGKRRRRARSPSQSR